MVGRSSLSWVAKSERRNPCTLKDAISLRILAARSMLCVPEPLPPDGPSEVVDMLRTEDESSILVQDVRMVDSTSMSTHRAARRSRTCEDLYVA